MAKRKSENWEEYCKPWHRGQAGNGVYGLGFVGALIYYVQHAASVGAGVIGVLKALVWPAFIVYEVLKFFKM